MLIAGCESVTARRAVIMANLAITNSCHEFNFTADSGKMPIVERRMPIVEGRMSMVEGKMPMVEGRIAAVAGMPAMALARQQLEAWRQETQVAE